MHLSLFAHWAVWMNVLGTAIVALPFGITFSIHEQKVSIIDSES